MPFRPNAFEIISIDGKEYRFNPQPDDTDSAFTITGKRATVYQLQDEQGALFALKVFSLAYRSPQIAAQALQLAPLQSIPGLEACNRRVLIPVEQAELVITHPELRYAVLMPWLPGRTLEELLSEEDALTPEQGLMAAQKLAETLAELEARGVVHGNLNPSNLLVDLSAPDEVAIHLVGLEGMRFDTAQGADFDATSDSFDGAMLLAELLSGEVVREDVASQEDVAEIIEDRWGRAICDVYERAVSSPTPTQCPPFSEWVTVIAKFNRRVPNETDNLKSGIGKDLRKAQQEVTPRDQANPRYVMNGAEAKVRKLAPTDSEGKIPDLAKKENMKDSNVIRFLYGWGGLFLFFALLAILMLVDPYILQDYYYSDFPIISILEAMIALIWIWRIQHRQYSFSVGWLFGSILVFILLEIYLVPWWRFGYSGAYIFIDSSVFELLAYELLIAGYFLSVHHFKESLSFKKSIPPYIWFIIAYIIIKYIGEYYITSFIFSLPLVLTLIIIIFLYTKQPIDMNEQKVHLAPKNRTFINVFFAIIVILLLSYCIYVYDYQKCTSNHIIYTSRTPFSNDGYAEYNPEKEEEEFIIIIWKNLWGNKMYVRPYYYGYILIEEVDSNSPAEKAGLQEGDKIVNINGQEIDYYWEIKDIIEANLSARLDFEIIRDNRTIHAFVTPHLIDDTRVPKIGVTIDDDSDVWGFIDSDEVTCNN